MIFQLDYVRNGLVADDERYETEIKSCARSETVPGNIADFRIESLSMPML